MLQLHDRAKADLELSAQRAAGVASSSRPARPGSVFSDQVLHAAMGGQHMMEQTFYLEAGDLARPAIVAAGEPRAADWSSDRCDDRREAIAGGPRIELRAAGAIKVCTRFRPRLLDAIAGYDRGRFARRCGAGVTVGIVALPLAMAFAIAIGRQARAGHLHRDHRRLPDLGARRLERADRRPGGRLHRHRLRHRPALRRRQPADRDRARRRAAVRSRLAAPRRAGALHPGLDRHRLHQRHRGADRAVAGEGAARPAGSARCRPTSSPRCRRSRQHLDRFNPYAFGLGLASFVGLLLWARWRPSRS